MRGLLIVVAFALVAGGRPRPRAAVEAGLGDGMGEDAERAAGDEADYDDKEEGSTSLWSNMHICVEGRRPPTWRRGSPAGATAKGNGVTDGLGEV